jgi:hypothetical protein
MAAVESLKKNHSLRNFKGVNTQADRRMIDNDEFAWLENVMPIGAGNARTIPAQSAALATLPGGEVCYYMAEGNISNVAYMYMFCVSGSCYQVNMTTFAQTTVGAVGTFGGTQSRIAQWKNERVLIIDSVKGYFDWNGTTLTTYNGAIASVTVKFGGSGFTNATTTTLTPSSGAATFSCTLNVTSQVFSNAGTGYIVGDILTVTGGTFTSPATITVASIGAGGAIVSANLTTTGIYTVYPGANPVAVSGGAGSAATFTLTFGIYAVTVVSAGTGYVTAPTITVAGAGSGTAPVLVVNLAINTVGTSIATYAGRVWIGNGRTIVYSSPNAYNDFNPLDLAGSFIMSDDTLRTTVTKLYANSDLLYIIGSSSVNVISNVMVTSPVFNSTGGVITASVTTFSNTNLTKDAGTTNDCSVVSAFRSLAFVMQYGFMSLTGTTPTKISDALDGEFPEFDFTKVISGGLAIIYDILCLCFLVQYNDTTKGVERPLLCIFFNKKWFFASASAGVTFVATGSPTAGAPNLWATDGANLYKMFSSTTTAIAQTIKTKLWDMGDPLITKEAFKLGVESISSTTSSSVSVSVDTGINFQSYSFNGGNVAFVINNTGSPISMLNNISLPIAWLAVGYLTFQSNIEGTGNYLGLTVTSSSPGNAFIGFHLQYQPRTPWTSQPF